MTDPAGFLPPADMAIMEALNGMPTAALTRVLADALIESELAAPDAALTMAAALVVELQWIPSWRG